MKVKIRVNGEKVPINDFVQRLIGHMVSGAIEELHGVPADWKEIVVDVER